LPANVKAQVEEARGQFDLKNKKYTAELDTSKGPIRLGFLPEAAPGHVLNFLSLAKIGFYDRLIFHRVISGFMIQGGCPNGTGSGGPGYQIPAEFNATAHEAGVLSAARTNDPNSAGSQFFICLDRHPHLDRQYTAFGRVLDEDSMATVRAIGAAKTLSERPVEKVEIRSVRIVETPISGA
jgi:peptidyl-prolyl cis-trans isomerase B (cyclophilin B)